MRAGEHSKARPGYNLRTSKTFTTLDQHSSVPLPPDTLDALGIEAGAELEVEIVGRALVFHSVEEARRSKRRTACEELAKGPDQKHRLMIFPDKLDVLTMRCGGRCCN